MRTLYLHIGMHKTGSTSIQESLCHCNTETALYIPFGPINHSVGAMTVFGEHPERYHIHRRQGLSRESVMALRKEMIEQLLVGLAAPQNTLILSGEDFSLLSFDAVSQLHKILTLAIERIQIIAYVRTPVGYASSSFQQLVGGGLNHWAGHAPCYRDRFEKYIQIFGRTAVEIVPYRRETLIGGDVVDDFLHRIGQPDLKLPRPRSNSSQSLEIVAAQYWINKHAKAVLPPAQTGALRQAVGAAIKTLGQSTRLRFAEAAVVDEAVAQDVAWLESVTDFTLRDDPIDATEHEVASEAALLAYGADQLRALSLSPAQHQQLAQLGL